MKKDKTFRVLLREYFVVYGIIPAFTIAILLLAFVFFFQQYTIKKEIRIFNRQSAAALDHELKKQEQFLTVLADSDEIRTYLLTGKNVNSLYEQFYEFNRNTELKAVIHILNQDGEMLSSSIRLSDQYSSIRIQMIAERIQRMSPVVLKESNILEYPAGNQSVYTLGTVVSGTEGVIGYIMLQTLEDGIASVIKPKSMLRQIAVDKFDRIVSTQNELDYQLGERFYPQDAKNQFYLRQTSLDDFGITLYTSGTISPLQRSYGILILFAMLILILLIVLVNNISKKVSVRVTEPIANLVTAFSHLKTGETEYLSDLSNIEEFRFLSEEYNHMISQLNQLMARNAELSEIRRIAEIKQLEAQFDPHFFLNMLETLRYMSLMSHEEAEKMIFSLSGILRYSLYNKDQYSSVADDMKYVEDYLYLQKTRIGSNFSYRITLDDTAKTQVIPKLLIQPLIENSVKHGYQGVPGFCIEIKLYQEDGDLMLQVFDNGRGISRDHAERLMRMIRTEGSSEHIGLSNVHKRLEYMYGDGYGILSIDVSTGFLVTVRIKGGVTGDEL